MITGLPRALELEDGREYPIRWDFRDVLNLIEAMNDPEVGDRERGYYLLTILYEDFEEIHPELYGDAVKKGLWFLNCGEVQDQKKAPKLMDWEQDLPLITPAINRVAGVEVRTLESLHWWTFVGYYQEIGGECTFAQVVSIRDKLRRGKMDKTDREYYNRNRSLIDLVNKRTTDEDDFLAQLMKRG